MGEAFLTAGPSGQGFNVSRKSIQKSGATEAELTQLRKLRPQGFASRAHFLGGLHEFRTGQRGQFLGDPVPEGAGEGATPGATHGTRREARPLPLNQAVLHTALDLSRPFGRGATPGATPGTLRPGQVRKRIQAVEDLRV